MNIELKDKVAMVTMAAGGAGFSIACTLAKSGAKVVLADVNEHLLKRSMIFLKEKGFDVSCVKCDVSKEDDVKNLINRTVEIYGSLDFAYNNAIVKPITPLNLADIKKEYFDKVMSVNLFGFWNCMKYEILQMQKQNFGRIYNSISDGDLPVKEGISIFKSAQNAVISLSECANLEYNKNNIRIYVTKSLPSGDYFDIYGNKTNNSDNSSIPKEDSQSNPNLQ